MLETENTIQTQSDVFKDVPIAHASIIESLKSITGTVSKETPLIKISTEANIVQKLNLQVYRRQDNVWQAGNTGNVSAKYRFYDANKSPITEYVSVPSGELQSQYVIVDINNVPSNAKYISFSIYMTGLTISTKEHRIKITINTVSINSPTMAMLMANATVKNTYSTEKPYWVHQFGPFTLTTGKLKVDANNVHMAIGDYSFSNYDSMTATNSMDLNGTTGYVYVKSLEETYKDKVVYIDEGITKIPTTITVDTQRTTTSDVTNRIINCNSGKYFISKTSTYTGGIASIPETVFTYRLHPVGVNLPTSKFTVRAYRQIGKTMFIRDYANGTNEYVKISYSVDNGTTYNELVCQSDYMATIDIPSGITEVLFKYSAKNLSGDTMTIVIEAMEQEVYHKRMQFYTMLTSEMLGSGETVLFGTEKWTRYEIDLSYVMESLPQKVDFNVGFTDSNYVKIGCFNEYGEEKVTNGKIATIDSHYWPVVNIYIKQSTSELPTSVYLTTIMEKTYNISVDTHRKITGKLLTFNFDSKRTINTNDSFSKSIYRNTIKKDATHGGSARRVIKNIPINSDLSRLIANKVSFLNKSIRKVIKNSSFISDSKRKLHNNSNKVLDSLRKTIKNDYINPKTNRNTIKEDAIVSDTNRKMAIEFVSSFDSNRILVNNDSISIDTSRLMNLSLAIVYCDTSRKYYNNVISNTATNRKLSINKFMNIITKRAIGDTGYFSANIKRISRYVHKSTPMAKTKRVLHKNHSFDSKTNRFLAAPINKTLDSTRNVVHDRNYTYDTYRKTIKNANITSDTNKITHCIDNIVADTSKKIQYGFVMPIDTKRETRIKYEFASDTDRLPFYFIDINAEAVRSQVYHKRAFLFDTARDKYREDVTVVRYDTLRAVNVINPYAKVYEYNIKVCNTLYFDINVFNK